MKHSTLVLFLILFSYNLNSQIKWIKKENTLLFNGYYNKTDSIKFNYTDLNSTSSSPVNKDLNLNNNPSCINIDFSRSGILYLSFSSYTSTYLFGVDNPNNEDFEASVVASVKFEVNSTLHTIVDSHTFTIKNIKGTNDFEKHALNKHVLKIDIPDLLNYSSGTISKIQIELDDYSQIIVDPNGNYLSKFQDEVNFEAFYIEDINYDISYESEPLISVNYLQNSNSYSYDYIENVEENYFRKIRLQWENKSCDEFIFDNYQVQLLKIDNLEDKFNSQTDFNEFETDETKIDWSKATTFEIGNSNTFIDLYITLGKGYYTWRVRPMSYFHEGNSVNNKNWGIWNSESMKQGDVFDINKSSSSNTFYYFYYDNQNDDSGFDLTDNLNWQHVRIFNEGDKEGSKHFDEIIYSDNLLGKRQYQKKLNNNDYEVLSEFIPDHSGRSILTSIPVPASHIDNWESYYSSANKPDHGTDLLYKNNVLSNPSKSFSIAQFDLGDPNPSNDLVENPESIDETYTISPNPPSPNGLIMDYYNSSSTPYNIPKTQGYPFSRVIFYNDGTERVKEEIIPDSYKYLQSDKELGSVKYFYTEATQKELYSLFGKEAPDSSKVFKQITKDENKNYHINYKDNKGNVIASGILKNDNSNFEEIQNTSSDKELLIDGSDKIFPMKKETRVVSTSYDLDYEFINYGKFYLQDPSSGTFTYDILDEELEIEFCDIDNGIVVGNYSLKIPYKVNLDVICSDEFYSNGQNQNFSSTTSNNFASMTPSSSTSGTFSQLYPSNYSVSRNIKLNIDSLNNYFINYRNRIYNELYSNTFSETFELIEEFSDPSTTMTFEDFIVDLDDINSNIHWNISSPVNNTINVILDNFNLGACPAPINTSFNYVFNICPSSTFPCGTNTDYEATLFNTFAGRDYFYIEGSNTISGVFTENVEDYFFRKFNFGVARSIFNTNYTDNYIAYPSTISDESYTYHKDNIGLASNNSSINKLIENMLSETFTTEDYQIRNNLLFESINPTGTNFLNLNVGDNIWTPADICECWDVAITSFELNALTYDENKDSYQLNKDFDLLNEFLNCTGKMLRGFTNTAFLDVEKGIDVSNLTYTSTYSPSLNSPYDKDVFQRQDTLYGGGYITNAHKYIYYDLVESVTFSNYSDTFTDLQWFGVPSPTNSGTFVFDIERDVVGSSTFYDFTLNSNPGNYNQDDPKSPQQLQKLSPYFNDDIDLSIEDLDNYDFVVNYGYVFGQMAAFDNRQNSMTFNLLDYFPQTSNEYVKYRDYVSPGSTSNTFNMQWEKLYYDWIGEDFKNSKYDKDNDKPVEDFSDMSKRNRDKLKKDKPDNIDFDIDQDLNDPDDPSVKFLKELENVETSGDYIKIILQTLSDECVKACDNRNLEGDIRDAFYSHQDNYIIEGDNFWYAHTGEEYSVDWAAEELTKYGTTNPIPFVNFSLYVVSLQEIEDYNNQLVLSCIKDCQLSNCVDENYNSTKSPTDNPFDDSQVGQQDMVIKNVPLGRADDPINNTTRQAQVQSCYMSEFMRLTKMAHAPMEIQVPIRDCNGDQQICEYFPEADQSRFTEWKTTAGRVEYNWNGEIILLPPTKEEYDYELQIVLDNAMRQIELVNNEKLAEYYNFLKENHPEDLDYYYYNGLTFLSSNTHKTTVMNIIRKQLGNYDKRIRINYYYNPQNDYVGYKTYEYGYQLGGGNTSTVFNMLNSDRIINIKSFEFDLNNFNQYIEPQLFSIPEHNEYSTNNGISSINGFHTIISQTALNFLPNSSFNKQVGMFQNNNDIKIENVLNLKFEIKDELVVDNNFIFFYRKIKNLKSFELHLIENKKLINKISEIKYYPAKTFVNRYLYKKFEAIDFTIRETSLNPAWSLYYEDDEPVFNGVGEFLAIPPFPEPEELTPQENFLCYRYALPDVNGIEESVPTHQAECEEENVYAFEAALLQYIDSYADALLQQAKLTYQTEIKDFVYNFDEFSVEQDDQVYQKMTLLYYDNSNNLVQTTPPKGVDIDESANTGSVDVDETLETIYQYNSLGQIVTSKTPDQTSSGTIFNIGGHYGVGGINYEYKGETIYIYDLAGRLRITVNPKQFVNFHIASSTFAPYNPIDYYAPKASYYKYDTKGRLIETGEFTGLHIKGLSEGQEYEEDIFTIGQYLEKYLKTKNTAGKSSDQIHTEKADFAKYNKLFEKYLLVNLDFPNDDPFYPANLETTPPPHSNNPYPLYQYGKMGLDSKARYIGLKNITKYDEISNNTNIPSQKNLQHRISEIIRIPDNKWNRLNITKQDYVTSIYSYDLHGNVDWYYQDIFLSRYTNDPIQKGKLVNYKYDLLSGKVTELNFQDGKVDEFTQKFEYDADNRLTTVASTRFDINVEKDVEYFYAKHGPLERKVLGNDQVQGVDYVYTIHGWLRTINSLSNTDNRLGGDGVTGYPNQYVPLDVFSMGLRYYQNDFQHVNGVDISYVNSYVTPPAKPQYNGNISEWETSYNASYTNPTGSSDLIDPKFKKLLNQYSYDISGRLLKSSTSYSNDIAPLYHYQPANAFSATFNYDLNGNMYNIDRTNEVGSSATYEIDIRDMTNQLAQTSHGGNSFSYTFDAMGQMITEKHISGSSTFEDVVDSIAWTADGKIEFVEDGTWMTYPDDNPMDGDWSNPEVLMIKKHYYYDGMGNRVAVVTQDPSGMIESYCQQDFGDFDHSIEECLMQKDHTIDTYYYEAGGKLLYKNKFVVKNTVTDYSPVLLNDIEWYVYGSASDGRVATVYPRYKIKDNDTYDDNFEDNPPSLEVAYNTEMLSNTFTSNAVSAGITGTETHRHLEEKRYEIKDHLGNVRAVVSDIKKSSNYNQASSSWKFLADVRSMSNYYPYGKEIDKGTWSSSSYNFSYNGKQKEVFDKDFLDYGARTHISEYGSFITTDPLEPYFPNQSPYIYGANNPIANIDFEGKAAVQLHYQMTEDAYNNLGVGVGADEGDIANCASVYADHPSTLIRISLMIAYNMYSELRVRDDLYDYNATSGSQDAESMEANRGHSMLENNPESNLSKSEVVKESLGFAWTSILSLTEVGASVGFQESELDKKFQNEICKAKLGRALHIFQDAPFHGGISYSTHISWNRPFHTMYYVTKDQFGFFAKYKSVENTMSALIVYELGKNNPESKDKIIDFLNNNDYYMDTFGMDIVHKNIINNILNNNGFQMNFTTGSITPRNIDDSPLGPNGSSTENPGGNK